MKYWWVRILKVLMMVCLAAIVFGFLVEDLWNWLMPALFGLRAITFAQALGLFALSRTLVGGIRRPGGGPGWKAGLRAKFSGMSEEERERFRAGMKEGRGFGRGKFESSLNREPTDE